MLPHARAEPFFLASEPGARFCLYHAAEGPVRGALLYLHPFAEEMNKSRRMAALQARALAAAGFAVLQLDLHGCGDSDGEFSEARWERWLADVTRARQWLRERSGAEPWLWGLRLGALLAMDAAGKGTPPAGLLLWQPVLQGASHMTQFLRLKVAGAMLDASAPAAGTSQMRAALAAGEALEVAGYELAPQLVAAIDACDAAALAPPCPVVWIETVAEASRPAPPAATRVAAGWGMPASLHTAAGPQFWSSQEIEESPQLVALTCQLMLEASDA